MANRITTVIDFVTDGANKTLAGFKKSVGEAEGAVGKLKAGWGSLTASFAESGAAQAAAAGAAVLVAQKSIDAASDLNESINAVTVSYGDQADAVLELGEKSAESVGMSQRAFNELAVQFSSFAGKISEQTGQPVAAVLDDLTKRVADFASVMNLDANEAAQVFMSTLSGETEPIRRFGKDVSAAAVEQYALAEGLIASKSELTESIKVQARYGLLMQQTSDVAGDFANTSDGLANQQRILAAQVENLAAQFGKKLVPIVEDAANTVTTLISAYDDLKAKSDSLGAGGGPLGWLGKANGLITEVINPLKQLERATAEYNKEAEKSADVQQQSTGAQDRYTESLVGLAAARNREIVAEQEATRTRIAGREAQEAYVDLLEAKAIPVLEAEAEAQKQALEASKALTEQYNDQQDAIEDLISSKLELVGGELAVRDAQRRGRQAADELDDSLGDLEEGTDAYQGALDDATQAQLDSAQAAADYRAQQMEANGSTVDAKVKARLMAEELYALAGTLNGPLKDAVLAYIAQLMAIPTNINTKVTVTGGGGVTGVAIGGSGKSGVTGVGGNMGVTGKGAEGAVVNTPTVALIGEAGPEALVPLDKLPGNAPIESMLGNGGGYTLYVAPGAIVLQGTNVTPEQVINALKKYERFNGPGWRR